MGAPSTVPSFGRHFGSGSPRDSLQLTEQIP